MFSSSCMSFNPQNDFEYELPSSSTAGAGAVVGAGAGYKVIDVVVSAFEPPISLHFSEREIMFRFLAAEACRIYELQQQQINIPPVSRLVGLSIKMGRAPQRNIVGEAFLTEFLNLDSVIRSRKRNTCKVLFDGPIASLKNVRVKRLFCAPLGPQVGNMCTHNQRTQEASQLLAME